MRVERTQNSSEQQRAGGCSHGRRREAERERDAVGLHQDGAGIGADAEIGGMAERDETRIAEQQIEARREQGEDGDVGCQERVEARAEPGHAGRGEEDQHGPGNPAHLRIGLHRFTGRPSRPAGRTTSTNAISTNTAKMEKPGQHQDAERQHLAEDDGAEEGAPERSEPADHHDDEGFDDDVDVHAGHDAAYRRDQGSAQAGEERAGHEHQRVELADIGAERGQHLAVVGGGAHHASGARAAEQQPAGKRDRRPKGDDEQVVVRHDDAEDLEPAGKAWRPRDGELLRAPDDLGDVAEDQHQRVREQQLVELLAAVQVAQEQPLDDPAQQRHGQGGTGHGDPEAHGVHAGPMGDLPGHVGADHVEAAVREVEHAQHAEDQRQSRGDDEQEHRRGQAAQALGEQERGVQHRAALASRSSRAAGRSAPTWPASVRTSRQRASA